MRYLLLSVTPPIKEVLKSDKFSILRIHVTYNVLMNTKKSIP